MATAKKLPSGRWRCLVFDGMGENGKRIYKSFTADTKKEAEYLASDYELNRREKPKSALTVGDVIDRYIESRENQLSPSTICGYRKIRRNQLQNLMDKRIADLTSESVQKAVNADARTHSDKTVKNAYGLLSAALAMQDDNINIRVRFPQSRKREITIPDHEAVSALMRECRGKMIEGVILLAAYAGMRRSEICALRWTDIDLKNGIVHVRRAVVSDDSGNWIDKDPKTAAGRRDISVPPLLIDRLLALKSDDTSVFPCTPCAITHQYERAAKKVGFPYRFHDLRHYNASIMHAMGVPDKYAAARLGHSTTDTTKRVYQHIVAQKELDISSTMRNRIDEIMQAEMLR